MRHPAIRRKSRPRPSLGRRPARVPASHFRAPTSDFVLSRPSRLLLWKPGRCSAAVTAPLVFKLSPAFTLIELLVVISIIAVLMGLVFPVVSGVIDRAKRVQAKNDVTQIVTAVTSFQTEYGRYLLPANQSSESYTYAANNDQLFNGLRGNDASQNTRNIVFLTIPAAKDTASPKSGIGGDGRFYDPWGMPYSIAIDADYNNKIENPYQNIGFSMIDAGCVSYSSGKNKTKDNDAKSSGFDDVLSWQ